MNYYIYIHRNLIDDSIFYVGMGSAKNYGRAKSKSGRNTYWKNIVNKYGFNYEILMDNLSKEDACEVEIYLIISFGRRDINSGILVNMSKGCEGAFGVIRSIETREKMSKALKGRKQTEEQKKAQSDRMKGENHPMYGKVGYTKGRKFTKEHKEKISIGNTGKKRTEEAIKNLSDRQKGIAAWNKIKVINSENYEIYETALEVSKLLNISYGTFLKYLKNPSKNPTPFILLTDYELGFIHIPYKRNLSSKHKNIYYIKSKDRYFYDIKFESNHYIKGFITEQEAVYALEQLKFSLGIK